MQQPYIGIDVIVQNDRGEIVKGTPFAKSECDAVGWFAPEKIAGMELAFDHKQMLIDEGIIRGVE